ncbi:hypothetical protein KAW48_08470, partial [candidate division WOR-3 bacterium]|nr:hypothetical protein [candidate division WOR-3 bacterium]
LAILLFLSVTKAIILYAKIPVNNVPFLSYSSFDTYIPFISVSSGALMSTFFMFPLIAALYFSIQESLRKNWMKYTLILLGIIAFSVMEEKELLSSIYMIISNMILVFLIVIIARYLLKDNLLSYIIGLSTIYLLPMILMYIYAGSNYYFLNGIFTLIFYSILIYLVVISMRKYEY